MATNKTLKALSQRFPECLQVHMDIKKLMPERDALKLLHSGFTDCSWGNDECPSYFFDVIYANDVATLMVCVDENQKVCYTLSYPEMEHFISYHNVEEAIKAYKLLLIKEEA
tara:strand:+ start:166 stop:501 length:336 start_codon:yes stop_codon:yes gene_type:complete